MTTADELPFRLASGTAWQLNCATYSLLCEVDWDGSRPVLLGVTVRSIKPEQVPAGSILRAATS
jgi:hypothetical protein